MTTSPRRFAPPIWAILFTVAAIASFVRLGLWQLDRAEQKRALATQYERGGAQAVVLQSSHEVNDLPRYQQVIARGRYENERQILLDNMPSTNPVGPGRPGYRVWTPFVLETGGRLLIDRGWIPAGPSREQLPSVEVSENLRTIEGRIDELPRPGLRMGTAQPRGRWPELLNYPTAPELEALFGEPLPDRVLLLDPRAAEGYERIWQAATGFGPDRHVGYAVQWFALAAAVLAVFVVVNLRSRPTP